MATNKMSPVHPGEVLREELDERDLSANGLAGALDIPTNRITAILNGQRGVTADTARRLSRYFGTTPELWLNLQKAWELRRAEISAEQGPVLTLVPAKGSLVGGRPKDKIERITEVLGDLQLAIGGFGTQASDWKERQDLPQVLGAFARLCSVFLRKLVLGDRGVKATRLLDDAVLETLDLRLQPLRKIPKRIRRTIETGLSVDGGYVQVTKLDELRAGSTHRLPVAPHELSFVIDWPLPGVADWTGVPSDKSPWPLGAEQLFDIRSRRTLSCDEWLSQQVLVFDDRGISLKDMMRAVVTYEGAHAVSVARFAEIEGHKPLKPTKEPALHILNNITVFGIRFVHAIIIEAALYLYERLLEEPTIQRPKGDIYVVKPCFSCPTDQASSSRPNWLGCEGTMMMTFSSELKQTRHRIRPVN